MYVHVYRLVVDSLIDMHFNNNITDVAQKAWHL